MDNRKAILDQARKEADLIIGAAAAKAREIAEQSIKREQEMEHAVNSLYAEYQEIQRQITKARAELAAIGATDD